MPRKTSTQRNHEPNICLAQINVESKNIEHNFSRMEIFIKRAISEKYDLIIFSELCLTGYFNGDWWESTSNLEDCEKYHKKILKLSESIDIIFGSVGIDWKKKNEDGRVRKYNAAFFASKGKFIQNRLTKLKFWPKILLPQYREFDDSRHFFDLRRLAYENACRIEDLYEPIQIRYHNKIFIFGLTVCEDIWDENCSFSPIKLISKKFKHNYFVNLSCSPFTFGKNIKRYKILKQHALTSRTEFIYVNCVGTQNIGKNIYTLDGSSQIISKQGQIVAKAKFCEEDFLSVSQQKNSYKELSIRENFDEDAQILLENALSNTCRKWNIKKVVIGVSGGIDSALTSVLMTRVLGADNVFLVNLPTKFNSPLTQNAAKKLASNLGCPYSVVDINETVHAKKSAIDLVIFQNEKNRSTIKLSPFNFENVQARERGSGILAAIASSLNTVFVCNTNKSEMTIGYGTLYGDIAGFLCPIGDLWKHQVYSLAHYYNKIIYKKEVIPQEIFKIVPSAELSEEQDVTTGKGDPLVYDYHDLLFASWVEHWDRKTLADCLNAYQNDTLDQLLGLPKGRTKQIFKSFEMFKKDTQKWWELFTGLGSIKRVQAPPILSLSRRSFGYDYRESI